MIRAVERLLFRPIVSPQNAAERVGQASGGSSQARPLVATSDASTLGVKLSVRGQVGHPRIFSPLSTGPNAAPVIRIMKPGPK